MEMDKSAAGRPLTELKDWLEATGTTQQALARVLDVSEAMVSLYINGKRGLSVEPTVKLALLTGLPVEKLLMPGETKRLFEFLGERATSTPSKTRKKRRVA
jgi:transcriptional regulator with XRE-family HTH domain